MINNTGLLKDLTALSAVGGNPFDYFEDIGVKEVAIYGNDDLVSIVWTYGYWSNVKVKYIIGDREQNLSVNVGELTRSASLHISTAVSFSEKIPIVLLEKSSVSLKNTIHLKHLISYSRKKRMLLDKVLKYKLENPGVKVLLLGLPSIAYVKDKTKYEKALLACGGNIIIEKDRVSKYLSDYMRDRDYGKYIFKDAVFHTIKDNGVYFLEDKSTKYVNVKNGYRIVPNAPDQYEHTIYTFGNSLCMGMYTDDEHTIQYQLQKRLNEYQKNGIYRVLNAANGGQPNYNKMWKSVEYHKPQAGDIIVLVAWFDSMIKRNPNYSKYFEFFYPQQELRLFDRPHNYGDFVWVDRVHLNCKSYVKVGDCLADKIIQMCEKSEENKGKFFEFKSNIVLPDSDRLEKNKYWKFQHFKHTDYLEYVRKRPLIKEDVYTDRWLNFEIKKPLLVDKKYKISILMKYEEDVSFKFFLHGGGKIDYLPVQSIKANEWTTVEYEYIPKSENIHWLSLSATNFKSAGQKLFIKKITITKKN